jgi:hypothetical protein
MKPVDVFRKYIADQKNYLKHLKEQRQLHKLTGNLNDLYNKVHRDAAPVFVLSTGRVGTKLFTELLNADDSVYAVHEPLPELTYHSMKAFKAPKGAEAKVGVDVARYELIRNAFLLGKKYVETNNRITFFAHALADLYPKAKFIHLVRNPDSFVKSGAQRGWYSGENVYDEGRIKMDDVSQWNALNNHEKIAWLWAETNRFIEVFKQSFSSRTFTLKAEDLYAGNENTLKAMAFMEVKMSADELKKRVRKKVNKSKTVAVKEVNLEYTKINFWQELKEQYGY